MAHVRRDCNRDSPAASPPCILDVQSGQIQAAKIMSLWPAWINFVDREFRLLRRLLRSGWRAGRARARIVCVARPFGWFSSSPTSPVRLRLSPTVSYSLRLFSNSGLRRDGCSTKAGAGIQVASVCGAEMEGIRRPNRLRLRRWIARPRLRAFHI